jgi:hypothetical protein
MRFLIVFGIVLVFTGCQRPVPPPEPAPMTLVVQKGEYDLAWDETLDVLNEHYFIPDRQDRRDGLIITYPSLSKQWFKFWRDDAQGSYDVCESSMHSIRRIVRVKFIPQGERVEIQLTVTIQRKSQPQRQVTTSSGAFQVFRDRVPLVETGEAAQRSEIITWNDLGKDVRLANYLLEKIERRLPESQMTVASAQCIEKEATVEK